jgi:acetylornithine deacetylase
MDMAAAPSTRALEMARALVRINTVSRESNLPLIELIRDELARHGVASRLTFDDERKKANLFATLGAGKPAGVILSGHTDTVPWDGQDWSVDPLGAGVKDGRLYGRGSADMKSFIGLAVAQVPAFLAADLPFAIHLAFSYDEEVGGFGARRLIADMRDAGVAPLACIVGEPTGMIPALAHKGVYRWRCCVRGHAAHSSLTPQSVNAIEVGARVVAKLADMAARWRDEEPRYEGFDVPYSTGSVGVIEGGIADNVVPADCRFHYEFRNLPGSDVTAMQARSAPTPRRSSRRCAPSTPMPESASRRSARCRRSSPRPTIPPCCSRSASPPPTRRRWSPSAPRPACSSAPARRPSCAARATSRRRTRPTNTFRSRSSPRPSVSCSR